MAADEKSQALERLAKLTLEDQPSVEPPVTADGNAQSSSAPMHGKPVANHNKQPEDDRVDMAIKQALEDNKERATVLSIEEQVEKFILDTKQQLLEFPSTFTNYQRMLAHRIAQHYGLQTSTVDYEDGPGRVIARRTPWCRQPPLKVKLADLKPASVRGAAGVPKVLVRRPAADDPSFRAGTPGASTSQPNAATVTKDREEDYNQARERIIGKSADVNMRAMNGRGRGGYMGGRGGAYSSTPRSPGGGRGTRKAVFRDRDKELQDPDYRRGGNRFPGKPEPDARSDTQLGYHSGFRAEMPRPSTSSSTGPTKSASPIPTSPARSFSSDYNGWNPKGYRPPPPPPMTPPGAHTKGYHHHHPAAQHPNFAMPRPYAPYAMAPYPMPTMSMAYHPGLAAGVGPGGAAHAYMPPFGAFPFHQYQMMAPGPEGLHMAAGPYQYYAPYAQHAYPTHFAPMHQAMPHPNMNSEKLSLMPAKSHGGSSNSNTTNSHSHSHQAGAPVSKPAPPPAITSSSPAEVGDKK